MGHDTGEDMGDAMGERQAAYGAVELQLRATLLHLERGRYSEGEVRRLAEALFHRIRPQPRRLAEQALAARLTRLAERARGGGWDDADLSELVRRGAGEAHVATAASLLDGGRPRLDTLAGFASGLRVAALLAVAPLLDAASVPSRQGPDRSGEQAHPKLAQVRALLAKAESTEYDEEAEALSAKAQELITRYALDQLVVSPGDAGARDGDVGVRRVWLDAPYVRAKATLVHHVAAANRCRSATCEELGFCLVVGSRPDLAAVELLVTSLLVQADRAMLRLGRRSDVLGRSRTRSFRQAFLVSYAVRIGERLRDAAEEAVAADSRELLPVLRDHELVVAEAFDAMVPHTVGRPTTVSNGEGWAAGAAAADLAQLDVHHKLRERSAG